MGSRPTSLPCRVQVAQCRWWLCFLFCSIGMSPWLLQCVSTFLASVASDWLEGVRSTARRFSHLIFLFASRTTGGLSIA